MQPGKTTEPHNEITEYSLKKMKMHIQHYMSDIIVILLYLYFYLVRHIFFFTFDHDTYDKYCKDLRKILYFKCLKPYV